MDKHNATMDRLAIAIFGFHFLSLGTPAWGQTTPPKLHPGLSPERARILFHDRLRERRLLAQNTQSSKTISPSSTTKHCSPGCQELIEKVSLNGSINVIVTLDVPNLPTVKGVPEKERSAVLKARAKAVREAQDRAIESLGTEGVRVGRKLTHRPVLGLKVDTVALKKLIANPKVKHIQEQVFDRPMLNQSVPLIGADQAWTNGFTGDGYAIAILDTGIDAAHPFFAGKVVEQACFSGSTPGTTSLCPNGETSQFGPGTGASCSLPDCDHGTHVAGIAVGNGVGFSGVAKNAKVVAIQVFSRLDDVATCNQMNLASPCIVSAPVDQDEALDYVSIIAGTNNVVAVNMSLGGGAFTTNCDDDPRKPEIDNLKAIGVATVIASGENACNSLGCPDAISSPACISSAISVGATTKPDPISQVEIVANYSNSASFLSLLAPGGDGSVDGNTCNSSSSGGSICSSVPGGGFEFGSGTSMAAPHVAGAIAVLKQESPTANVADLLSVLQSSGVPITDAKNDITKPRIKFDDTWVARYASNGRYPVAIFTDTLGNAYVAGSLMDPSGSGAESYAVVKYDPSGNQLWAQTYNGGTWSEASAAATDGSGNIYVTGMVCVAADPNCAFLAADTVKFGSDGNQVWVKRLADGGPSNYNGVSAAVDNSANVYVTSLRSPGSSFSNFAYAVTKYDASGNQLWTSSYTNAGQDFPQALAIDTDGSVYVTGESFDCGPPDACSSKAATVKFGPDGIQQWAVRDGNFDLGWAIAVDASKNVYLSGFKSQSTTAVVKYDPSGTSVWTSLSLSDMSTVNALTLDASGNIFATGIYGYLDNGAKTKVATIKYDPSGNRLWTALDDPKPGGFQAEGDAIAVDGSGNIYIAGIQNESTVTLKHGPGGELLWSAFQDGNSGSFPALAVLNGDVYMTTSGENAEFSTDFLTAKYVP